MPAVADHSVQPGTLLGRYEVVARIARGGMGEIWLARARGAGAFRKKIVVKTIVPDRARDSSFVDMLTREAILCAKLNHPNLIEVFDFFEDHGMYAIAMEYVAGRSLSQILQAAGAAEREIPPEISLRILGECCCGLEHAHAHDVIHCDLSPGNIMLSFAGLTKVVDFGVATSANALNTQLKGKYHYMAPERISRKITDPRTDVYALGVIMHLLFTGHLPITATSEEALLRAIVHGQPKPPSAYREVAPDVEGLILSAMARDPEERFQDAGSLLRAIARCRDSRPCTQIDAATFVGALFPESTELPAHVRHALSAKPATRTGEPPRPMAGGASAELDDYEISLHAPPDPPPTSRVPSRMVQLFATRELRALRADVFGAKPAANAHAGSPGYGMIDDTANEESPPPSRGVFRDLPPKDAPWPWPRSRTKP